MDRSQLPLNALRAFEASARHLSFTAAANELCVTQAAVSHHIKALEARLGVPLFRRLPRGLALTDEGEALAPSLRDAFDRLAVAMRRIEGGYHEVLTVGVVGTFATGWLLPRVATFEAAHPGVDLRLLANNNRADLAGEGLDLAIRFGDGAWHGVDAEPLMPALLSPLCAPGIARRLAAPGDLAGETLLRSYRAEEWPRWFEAAGVAPPRIRGPMFDSSPAMAQAAAGGAGVALLPARLFEGELAAERLVQPFPLSIDAGCYWLTRLRSRGDTPAMAAFRRWIVGEAGRASV
jgi:LysR family transcriptional regulator of beta-lactamase